MQAEIHDDQIDRDVLEVSLTGQMLLEHPLRPCKFDQARHTETDRKEMLSVSTNLEDITS